jgi:hypothetical protein
MPPKKAAKKGAAQGKCYPLLITIYVGKAPAAKKGAAKPVAKKAQAPQ